MPRARPIGMDPPTDDRPFFNFLRKRWGPVAADPTAFLNSSTASLLNSQLRKGVIPLDVAHLFVTAFVGLVFVLVFVLAPLYFSEAGRASWPGRAVTLLYFSCLGLRLHRDRARSDPDLHEARGLPPLCVFDGDLHPASRGGRGKSLCREARHITKWALGDPLRRRARRGCASAARISVVVPALPGRSAGASHPRISPPDLPSRFLPGHAVSAGNPPARAGSARLDRLGVGHERSLHGVGRPFFGRARDLPGLPGNTDRRARRLPACPRFL